VLWGAALAAQLAVGWFVWREIRRRWPSRAAEGAFVAGVAFVCLFSTLQLQSIVFMSTNLFPIVLGLAVAAIVSLVNASERGATGRARWLTAAGLASAGAALTMTNGLVVPWVLALVAWTRRETPRVVVEFSVAGMFLSVAYLGLVGLPWVQPPAADAPPRVSASIGETTIYFLTFFGNAAAHGSVALAAALGVLALGIGCRAVWLVVRERTSAPRIEHVAVGLMLFAVLSMLMAAPMRAQFGAIQAAQSRYATYALAYWTAVVLWTTSRLDLSFASPRLERLLVPGAVTASCVLIPLHVFVGLVWQAKSDNLAVARLALVSGVRDDEWMATLHPAPSTVYETAGKLRGAGDPDVAAPAVGTVVRVPPALDRCEGSFRLRRTGPASDWRASGSLGSQPGSDGVIVDAAGAVQGLAQTAPVVSTPNPPDLEVVSAVWRSLRRQPARQQWVGFARQAGEPPFTFYAVDEQGTPMCEAAIEVGAAPLP
jgi:hypothetical protein